MKAPISKPTPPEPKAAVQIITRLTPESRATIRALAADNGITVQALGVYAWSLALQSYGRRPLPEASV